GPSGRAASASTTGSHPPGTSGGARAPTSVVAPMGAGSWVDVVCTTCGKKLSKTRPAPAPPSSASPTRHHHPHWLVLAFPVGSGTLDQSRICAGWSAVVTQVAAQTTCFKLVSWSVTTGNQLVVTTDALALDLSEDECKIIREVVCQHCGLPTTS